MKTLTTILLVSLVLLTMSAGKLHAQDAADAPAPTSSLPKMTDVVKAIDKATASESEDGKDWAAPVKLALVFTGLAILPSLLVMTTSFTRIVIVLSFVRRALTTQNIPPTVAIIALAMFLTIFTMSPTFAKINEHAIKPYLADELDFESSSTVGVEILKEFMIRQTRKNDLALFVNLAQIDEPATTADVPIHVAIPSFAISEFRTAFEMGCLLFIPFLLVDLVVAGILLSAGMMMLPPAIISLPFKIILFVLVDGWNLIAKTLVTSFRY